jgi:tRNA(Ile)-lysidine synthase
VARDGRVTAAVEEALTRYGLGRPGETLVVALSGGADSVALTDALATLARRHGFRLLAAHLDHGLRPESASDAAFCAELAGGLGLEVRLGRADVRSRAGAMGSGLEDAARRERYAFLRTVKEQEGAVAIAVAHSRDDQAETLLLHLLRGAGTAGLAAMRPWSRGLLRPLLAVPRRELVEHCTARGLPWREDATNHDLGFLRNRVRHELLPYLESRFNPRTRETLARAARLLADDDDVLEGEAAARTAALVRASPDGFAVSRAGLTALAPAVARRVLRQALAAAGGREGVTASHVDRLLALAASARPSGRSLALPGGRTARFHFEEVRVGRRPPLAGGFVYPLNVPDQVELPGGLMLEVRTAAGPAASNPEEGADSVVGAPAGEALLVRTRRPGDRVCWRGREMSLKRFLMERRVPAEERAGLALVAAGSRVLWVTGQPCLAGAGERWLSLRLRARESR